MLTLMDVVDWSRAQFAMTAMYHWLFVPLTLGLGFIVAIMHTFYYRSGGDPLWERITKFWMKLFGINFAIGLATGLILEFEFGTNWSNYSYFVGDIFGAPLAIEGIFAFFLEATFFAVMFFGWNRVSRGFHLTATWLTAIGANLSALWILVANNWMQYPVGMRFNLDTARNEMDSFWALLNPMALNKFYHTVLSGFVLSGVFVVGIAAWFLWKKRDAVFARKSLRIGAWFGLISSVALLWTGDKSAVWVARKQPMKLAAMEGLYTGGTRVPLTAIGWMNPKKNMNNDVKEYYFDIKINGLLSLMAFRDIDAFVPGIRDLVLGNAEHDLLPVEEKMKRGRFSVDILKSYQQAKQGGDEITQRQIRGLFAGDTPESKDFLDHYFRYFGYGFLDSPEQVIPNVPLIFYSFRIMVGLGFWFILLFALLLIFLKKDTLYRQKWLLWLSMLSVPLAYLAGQAGWVVAEVGRQPWAIQDVLPTMAAVSKLNPASVQVTFFLFAALFTILLIAELKIMFHQIKLGPNNQGGSH